MCKKVWVLTSTSDVGYELHGVFLKRNDVLSAIGVAAETWGSRFGKREFSHNKKGFLVRSFLDTSGDWLVSYTAHQVHTNKQVFDYNI